MSSYEKVQEKIEELEEEFSNYGSLMAGMELDKIIEFPEVTGVITSFDKDGEADEMPTFLEATLCKESILVEDGRMMLVHTFNKKELMDMLTKNNDDELRLHVTVQRKGV